MENLTSDDAVPEISENKKIEEVEDHIAPTENGETTETQHENVNQTEDLLQNGESEMKKEAEESTEVSAEADETPQVLAAASTEDHIIEEENKESVIVEEEPAPVPIERSLPTPAVQNGLTENDINNQMSSVITSAEEIFPSYLNNILSGIANKEEILNARIAVEQRTQKGDGFVGIIYDAVLSGTKSSNPHELRLIVKVPPTNVVRRTQFGAMRLFKRESLVYNEILPEFIKFQREKGIKEEHGFYGIPKCYYAHFDEEKDESAIILENKCPQGFKILDKFQIPDFPHARRLFIELAKFHATSLAMKQLRPEVFDKFKTLPDMMCEKPHSELFRPVIEMSIDRAIETLDPHEEYKKEKLLHLKENVLSILEELGNGEKAEPYAVVNHGDCWINNMLFGYEHSAPTKISLIDWQVSRYASPVLDLVYFLFTCTDKKFRDNNYDNLIQIYYKALREQLERLGCDANKLMPYTALLRHLKKYGKFGLSMAVFLVPMLTTANADLPDMNEMADKFNENPEAMDATLWENNKDKYKTRMADVIRDSIRLGFL